MARFYFDIDDGDDYTEDDEGQEMAGLNSMREAALCVLPSIARDKLPDSDRRDYVVRVRDEAGAYAFQATLSLRAEWLEARPARAWA
jgi:hypothetical protein